MGRRAKNATGAGGALGDPGDETTGALAPGDNGPLGHDGSEAVGDTGADDLDSGGSGGGSGGGSDLGGIGDDGPSGSGSLGDDGSGGRDNRRSRRGGSSGKRGRKPRAEASSSLVSADDGASTYTLATCMLSDFLSEVLHPDFAAEHSTCEEFAESLDNMLKLPRYKGMRKNVDTIIGPLMLMASAGRLFGPGVKGVIKDAHERKRNAQQAKAGQPSQRPANVNQGASLSTSNQGPTPEDGSGQNDFAYSEIGLTGPEDGYL